MKIQLVIASVILLSLTGCSSTTGGNAPKATAGITDTSSNALKIARAGGIYDIYDNKRPSGMMQSGGYAAANTVTGVMSGGLLGGAMGFASFLATPSSLTKSHHIFSWIPLSQESDPNKATRLVYENTKKAASNIAREKGLVIISEDEGTKNYYGQQKFTLNIKSGGLCHSKKWCTLSVFINKKKPTLKSQHPVTGVPSWRINSVTLSSGGFGKNKRMENHLEYYQSLSRYLSGNTYLFVPSGAYIEKAAKFTVIPMIFNRAKPLYFIKKK